jgi:solute carrier family 25 carnitine/acylcarnitine transporter 20/29
MSYRTFILTTIPQWVDKGQLSIFSASLTKASLASGVDTLMTTPFENIKTRQMKSVEKISTLATVKSIYSQQGALGFFSGTQISIAKSFPSWLYLFLGYHATKNQREKQNFLYTIFYATMAAVPITVATNPLDVIKSQIQAGLRPKDETTWQCSKEIFKQQGAFAFSRGFPFRLLHKSMMTAAGYAILDLTTPKKEPSEQGLQNK